MTRPKVLLTRPWPEAAQAYMQAQYDTTVNDSGKPLTPDALKTAMMEYDALCPTVTDKLTAEIFATPNARVRMIGNFGAGYEHIDIEAAKAAGGHLAAPTTLRGDCIEHRMRLGIEEH